MPDVAKPPRIDAHDILNLIGVATETIDNIYTPERHQIAAAIMAKDGTIVRGVHVEAMVGRASTCAEAVALGNAALVGVARSLVLVAAVRNPKPTELDRSPELVWPCGLCREILLDYSPLLHVIGGRLDAPVVTKLSMLLPNKYIGTKWDVREVHRE